MIITIYRNLSERTDRGGAYNYERYRRYDVCTLFSFLIHHATIFHKYTENSRHRSSERTLREMISRDHKNAKQWDQNHLEF